MYVSNTGFNLSDRRYRGPSRLLPGLIVVGGLMWASPSLSGQSVVSSAESGLKPLQMESVSVQGLSRLVRFYRPENLAEAPALLIALHGGGGTGERFRYLTDGAFDRLADEHGFLVAYPDALGGQWKGCRSRAPYRAALSGVDDIAFLRVVIDRAQEILGRKPAGVFAVGYSNGGHLVFRLALEAAADFDGLAAIGAGLPVEEERDCRPSGPTVPLFLVAGTEDPINPWTGGEVVPPGGASPGHVISAEATARYFAASAGIQGCPQVTTHPDVDIEDGVQVETRRWTAPGASEVVLMVVQGGGHTLPLPSGRFPADLTGRTGRDLNGAREIWAFFARQPKRE